MITFGAFLIVWAIVGPPVIEKSNYVPLIIGIIIAALSALLIIYIVEPLINSIRFIATHPSIAPLYLGLYITLIALYGVCIAISVIILLRGISLIQDDLK